MIHQAQELAADDVSWLAIRHPAVLRLIERELAAPDGDGFAAGLELACRVLGGRTVLGGLRLDHNTLQSGMVAVRSGRCDRAMVRSIRDQIDELGVALTPREQDAVATVIAAIIWGVLDASARELDDTLADPGRALPPFPPLMGRSSRPRAGGPSGQEGAGPLPRARSIAPGRTHPPARRVARP